MNPREPTLHIAPVAPSLRPGALLEIHLAFHAGAADTTVVLPLGADPTGILTYEIRNITSGATKPGRLYDPRSFASDMRRPLPVGAMIELVHEDVQEEEPSGTLHRMHEGRYRITAVYDEGRTFEPENRSTRVIRSNEIEIVVESPP